jgi:phosphatidate cytidylyltransferase
MRDFLTRLVTAIPLVAALLAAILLDPTPWSVVVFAAVVAALATDEYLRMGLPVTADDKAVALRIGATITSMTIVAAPSIWGIGALAPALAGSAIVLAALVLVRKSMLESAGRHLGVCLSGLVYIATMMAHLPLLKIGGKPHWLVVTLCTAFFADTVAYVFGRLWGKRKLYAAVSPGKSVEGAFGGIVGSVLATVGIGALWTLPSLPIGHAVIVGVLASVCGQTGDLVESMIKRTFGVKDSGNLLPGHGGMLDRIDALLFVSPVVYYFIVVTGT